jgi:threonylcarbamoyladenosine tRNA methylthiotransferase MtaB
MKIYLDTIGCRLNQSEIEKIASQFREAGHKIIENPKDADLVIVNTCTVTAKAAADSRKKIRHASRNSNAQIIATGCWATMEPTKAIELPNVTRVVPNDQKDYLALDILSPGTPLDGFNVKPTARQPLPGSKMRTRAFIKVQDGCNNHCTFCITRIARGRSHSRTTEEVLLDIQSAILGDVKEIVLSGVHLASWGQDFNKPLHLRQLIETILDKTDIPRLRLSSLETWDLDESFFSLWQDPRLCPHLHLPLQSGARNTLRRMARNITPDEYAQMVSNARKVSPEIAITTDIIVGFPGETDQDFEDSLAFIHEINFAGGHVFTFSPRNCTPAAEYTDQIPIAVRKNRSEEMRREFNKTRKQYHHHFIGKTAAVLWEKATPFTNSESETSDHAWLLNGLSPNYIRVETVCKKNRWNEISNVIFEAKTNQGLMGNIIDK